MVDVKQVDEHELVLEWESSATNDMIADSTLALVTGIDSSMASVKRKPCFFPPELYGSLILFFFFIDS